MSNESLSDEGEGQKGAEADDKPDLEIFSISDVGNVERTMFTYQANLWRIRTDLIAADRHGTKMSPRKGSVSLVESQHDVIDPADPGCAFDDGIEHRLHVRGRPADDAEHLGVAA
jgi:hypothetical protein